MRNHAITAADSQPPLDIEELKVARATRRGMISKQADVSA
jgi:hypothetical protein